MRLDDVLSAVRPVSDERPGSVVVIGGGKSAQDIAAYLAHEGRQRNVSMIFEKTDAFVASDMHIPDFIRKSRCVAFLLFLYPVLTLDHRLIGILSPHIELRSNLECVHHPSCCSYS